MNPTPEIQPGGGVAAEYKECFKCSFRGDTSESACPKCGKKLRTSKNIRVRGVIQIVTGVFLVLMMAGLSIFLGALVAKGSTDPDTAKKLSDQRTFLVAVYGFFGILALFGINGIVMGTWQIATGRRNKVLMWLMFVLLALIMIACFGIAFVAS